MLQKPALRMATVTPFYVMDVLRRARQMEAQGLDVIHMEIGEPDFATPQAIVDAGIRHLQTGQVKYTPAAGLPELRTRIAAFYRQRYGVEVAGERIFITPGASGAFLLALGVSLDPGGAVLMADPCYPCNGNFVSLFEGKAQPIPVDAQTRYQLTAAPIQKAWTDDTRGVLIASPSNPTGTLIAPDELQQAVQTTAALGGCFYSDEIYHGLVYGDHATTALAFSDQVFVINSFSKYFGMTGWRVGWLVVPEAFVDAAEKLAQNIFIASPSVAQYAALAAFDDDTQRELDRRCVELAARRDFLYQALLDLGFAIPVKPQGAFYLYADCSRFTDDSFRFALDLLAAQGVAVTPGKDFGLYHADRMLRFAYTTSIARMSTAMHRLKRFIDQGS